MKRANSILSGHSEKSGRSSGVVSIAPAKSRWSKVLRGSGTSHGDDTSIHTGASSWGFSLPFTISPKRLSRSQSGVSFTSEQSDASRSTSSSNSLGRRLVQSLHVVSKSRKRELVNESLEFVRKGERLEKETDEEIEKTFTSFSKELRRSFSRTKSKLRSRSYYFVVVDERHTITKSATLRWDDDYTRAISDQALGRILCFDIKYVSTSVLQDEDTPKEEAPLACDLRIVCVGRTLKLRAPSRESMKMWITGLTALIEQAKKSARKQMGRNSIMNFLKLPFGHCESERQKSVERVRELISERMNYSMGKRLVETMLLKSEHSSGNVEFADVFHLFTVKSSLEPAFRQFALPVEGAGPVRYLMSQQRFKEFLEREQQENFFFGAHSDANALFASLDEPFVEHADGQIFLTMVGFSHLMCCAENSLCHPSRRARVHQDMGKPLSHYWISSSHNTYLEGHQLIGESSLNRYVDVLMSGCRCVEIDCWEGESGEPIVTHGWTMTTKLSFRDVIRTCRDYAFIATPYPVILSLEVHCGLEQQEKLANILHETLGSSLLTHSGCEDFEAAELPSPLEAKHKFIIKAKLRPARSLLSAFRGSRSSNSTQRFSSGMTQKLSSLRNSGTSQLLSSGATQQLMAQGSASSSGSRVRSVCCGLCSFSPKSRSAESVDAEDITPRIEAEEENDDLEDSEDTTQHTRRSVTQGNVDEMQTNPFTMHSLYSRAIFMPTVHFPKRCQQPPTDLSHACTCTSMNERKASDALKTMGLKQLQYHHSARLSRIYPGASRAKSENFDPVPLWLAGFQMVALNHQTVDDHMIAAAGLFMNENGGCGYVLKPPSVLGALADKGAEPSDANKGCELELTIVSGHWLPRPSGVLNEINPSVIVSVCGSSKDVSSFQTSCIQKNDFNPNWDERFLFEVEKPEVALLRLEVVHIPSSTSEKQPVAAAALPFSGIREGFRWVPLLDRRLHVMEFCGLLVKARLRGAWSETRRAQVADEQADKLAARLISRSSGGLGGAHSSTSIARAMTPTTVSGWTSSATSGCKSSSDSGMDLEVHVDVPQEPALEKPTPRLPRHAAQLRPVHCQWPEDPSWRAPRLW